MSTERVQNRRESIWEVAFPISILNVFGATVLSDGKAIFEKKKQLTLNACGEGIFRCLLTSVGR